MTKASSYEQYYFAKQPILDENLSTYGYELLFRSSSNHFTAEITDPDLATINIVTCAFIKSQENTKQSKRIFINFTERLLMDGAPRALPPTVAVIELLEDICQTQTLLNEILRYKQEGYLIAIDDYHGTDSRSDFLDVADIIKIDVLHKDTAAIKEIHRSVEKKNAIKLAEKVEDGSAYRELRSLGFDLFQGYFFSRPENYSGKKISSSQTSRIRTLALLQKPELEPRQLVEVINSDPSIAYRLLRLLNSAAFGFSMKIESIQHAVVLLGVTRLKHWLHMVILSDVNSSQHPKELFNLALLRGRILEELAIEGQIAQYRPETLFLFGLLSLINVMLDMPFGEVFHDLPFSAKFKAGYLDQTSELNQYLQLLAAFEARDFEKGTTLCTSLNIVPRVYMEASMRAHSWTEAVVEEML